MTALLSLILPALLPAVADGAKGLFQKFFGGTKPINVDEQIKLMGAETEKLKVIAELDKPSENISKWVADLRASFRYVAAGLIILTTMLLAITYFLAGLLFASSTNAMNLVYPLLTMFLELTGSVFSFMFGDRVYLSLKGKK